MVLYDKPGIDHENQQISVQNRLRKRNGNALTRLSQRKRCGNTKQCLHFHLTRFPSKPSCGNATEFWTIRFPQLFRIAEAPYFTLCKCATDRTIYCEYTCKLWKISKKEAYKCSGVHSFSVHPRFQWGNRQTDLKELKIARSLNPRQMVAAKLHRPFTYAFWLAIWYGSCQKDVKTL